MNFNKYIFRCSSIGELMTNPRKKGETLSASTKTYLKELHKESLFGRNKSISSKYLDKGIMVEEDSITLYSEVTGKLFIKNKERLNNKFLTGEPDNKQNETIMDIKSSWDFHTFPLYETDIPTKDYYWQLHGYMALTGFKKAELVYCLVDTPHMLITDEKYRMCRKIGEIELPQDLEEEIERNLTYGDVPKELRIKKFEIERNDEDIEKIYQRVIECREYMNELSTQIIL